TSFSQTAGSAGLGGTTGPPSAWQSLGERFMVRQNHAPGLRLLTRFVEIANLPVHEQLPEIKKLAAAAPNLPVLVKLQLPAMEKVFAASVRTQALLRAAATGIAVERYRVAKGHWPGALAGVAKAGLIA